MYRSLIVALSAALFAAAPSAAQSSAELYEKNCVTAAQKAGQGCQALAASVPVDPVGQPPPPARSAKATYEQWGALADVVGGIWHSPGILYTFEWEKPGVLLRRSLLTGEKLRFALDDQGRIVMSYDPAISDGSFKPFSAPLARDFAQSGMLSLDKPLAAGDYMIETFWAFQRQGDVLFEIQRTQYSPEAAPREFRRLDSNGLETLRRNTTQIANPDVVRRNWGMTANLVGKTWAWSQYGTTTIEGYSWLEPGLSMIMTSAFVGDDAKIVAKPSRTVIAVDPITGSRGFGITVLPDGSIETLGNDSKVIRTMTAPDRYDDKVFQRKKDGQYKSMGTLTSRLQPDDANASFARFIAREQKVEGTGGGGLFGLLGKALQGAVAGASGMASGGGGYDAAVAGAAAGALAGAAGVDASQIQTGFREGAADVNARNAQLEAQMAASLPQATAPEPSPGREGLDRAITVASSAASDAAVASPTSATSPPRHPVASSSTPVTQARPSAAEMCTSPGGSREWSTGGLTSLKDAQAAYEQEAAFQRGRGSSMSPMRASGKTIAVFGEPHANYVATITWPPRSAPCGSRVSPQ